MLLLLIATLLWALSFGLIKSQLAGLDPNLVAWARLALALPLLLPFLRWRELSLWPGRPWRRALWLVLIGAVQYGLMYTGYIASFGFAAAHEVALFTVTTPIFVVLLLDTRRHLMRVEEVGRGLLDSVLVHPREVFRPALIAGAHAILVAHNHPTGDPTPSAADIRTTRDLIRAGQLLRVELLDHLIIGRPSSERTRDFCSLKELGQFYS